LQGFVVIKFQLSLTQEQRDHHEGETCFSHGLKAGKQKMLTKTSNRLHQSEFWSSFAMALVL